MGKTSPPHLGPTCVFFFSPWLRRNEPTRAGTTARRGEPVRGCPRTSDAVPARPLDPVLFYHNARSLLCRRRRSHSDCSTIRQIGEGPSSRAKRRAGRDLHRRPTRRETRVTVAFLDYHLPEKKKAMPSVLVRASLLTPRAPHPFGKHATRSSLCDRGTKRQLPTRAVTLHSPPRQPRKFLSPSF